MSPVGLPPTADVSTDPSTWAHGLWFRRVFLALLAVVVLAGLVGVFGVRSREVSAQSTSGRVRRSMSRYAQSARAGLDVPFEIQVHRRGGFDHDVILLVSSDYLDLFNKEHHRSAARQ